MPEPLCQHPYVNYFLAQASWRPVPPHPHLSPFTLTCPPSPAPPSTPISTTLKVYAMSLDALPRVDVYICDVYICSPSR